GDDSVLGEELADRPIRQEQRRRALVLEPGAALVHPADEQRREEERERELQELGEEREGIHRTKKRSKSSVTKLKVRYTEMRPCWIRPTCRARKSAPRAIGRYSACHAWSVAITR